jgi:hypothetical protein
MVLFGLGSVATAFGPTPLTWILKYPCPFFTIFQTRTCLASLFRVPILNIAPFALFNDDTVVQVYRKINIKSRKNNHIITQSNVFSIPKFCSHPVCRSPSNYIGLCRNGLLVGWRAQTTQFQRLNCDFHKQNSGYHTIETKRNILSLTQFERCESGHETVWWNMCLMHPWLFLKNQRPSTPQIQVNIRQLIGNHDPFFLQDSSPGRPCWVQVGLFHTVTDLRNTT